MTEMVHRGLRRFYKSAGVEAEGDGFVVALDGRPLRSPAKRVLALPTAALAGAVAAEWEAQGEKIDPASMPLTRLANTAIDRTAEMRAEAVAELVGYTEHDHLCYWTEDPPELAARQKAVWRPLLDWGEKRLDATYSVTTSILHTPQPEPLLKAVRQALEALDDFRLTGVQSVAGSCRSVLLGLAVLEGRVSGEEAFSASQLEEAYQIEQWGEDEEAAEVRAALKQDIIESAGFLEFLG